MAKKNECTEAFELPVSYLVRFHRKDPASSDGVLGTVKPLLGEGRPTPFRNGHELLARLELVTAGVAGGEVADEAASE